MFTRSTGETIIVLFNSMMILRNCSRIIIHVSVDVLSDVLFLKAFKNFNYLIIFWSKYSFGKLRTRAFQ